MNLRKRHLFLLFLLALPFEGMAQEIVLKGRVYNGISNEEVPFAVVVLKDGKQVYAGTADSAGQYLLKVPKPGFYNLEVIQSGFKTYVKFEIELKPERMNEINIPLEENRKTLEEVTIKAEAFVRREESPLSMRSIGEAEIKRNPGANRDISKVLQSLPGVASVAVFRNDLIVRGGSPNENRFFLDGIEVPNINHFATQGASGGPAGLLNVDFISEVDFYSGAFPASRGNALSSVLDIKFKDGRSDKAGLSFTLGASDLATTFDGPLGKKSTLIASYRRSYLQFLFAALGLPFLPTYNDFQFKYKYKPDNKQEFTFLGLGAYDVLVLNKEANETDEQKYILGNLPENQQWNYTLGGSYKRFLENSFITLVISRNHLSNGADKYINNDESLSSNKILEYRSGEIENKFRLERTSLKNNWKTTTGISLEQAAYTNTTFNRLPVIGSVEYSSSIDFIKYGAFAQLSKTFTGAGLVLSAGLRSDANTFGKNMSNPLEQISPRLSLSKTLGEKLSFNANSGIYYQVPAYTILGYRDNNNVLQNEKIRYIRATHLAAGFEFQTRKYSRISLEGFYKRYSNYPFGLSDSISIANQGSDFGVVGDEPVDNRSEGRSYGLEILYQQKLFNGLYGLISYTWLRSEFSNLDERYIVSSWDYRHILSITAGKIFKRNWEVGVRFRFNSGNPYTPYDLQVSSLKENWDISGQGVLDNKKINSVRNGSFHQLDLRVDKKYYFKKWVLDIYLDVQNVYSRETELAPYVDVIRDSQGQAVSDPDDDTRYLVRKLKNTSGTLIPSIGVIVEL
ncbi:MAG: carboxypeptidase-like regulatory domain-containing protein [Bacteroidia bacterium]|nr:carboxypeptidase-like regulatory domain-containing protein [Bacteroidia bacterium]